MSAREEFLRVLRKYGNSVSVYRAGAETPETGLAFLQPILNRGSGEQELPTSLGTVCQDQFLYLGDPDLSLEQLGDGYVLCGGVKYTVRTAQPIRWGGELHHWWAVLTPRDEEAEV